MPPSSRFLRLLGPGSCSSPRGLQRELPRHLRGSAAAARASCEVRWEEAAWEPRGVDATEAREPRPQVSVRDPGRGGARVHSSLPLGLVSESGPPLPQCWKGPPHPQPTQRGGMARHKGTAEDLGPSWLFAGASRLRKGDPPVHALGKGKGLLTPFGVCVTSAFENLDENCGSYSEK